jgi:hypothetical protein
LIWKAIISIDDDDDDDQDRLPGRLSAVGTLFEQGKQDQDSDKQAGYKGLRATSRK